MVYLKSKLPPFSLLDEPHMTFNGACWDML
ncbi:hypothetical protein OKW50_004162 [Paraburkholderia youngii]